jgi:hypothetical protein
MSVCLDSWAVLAWLDGEEPALSRVNDLIGSRPVISWINLVEVYYRLERDHGREVADETLGALRANLTPDLPGTTRNSLTFPTFPARSKTSVPRRGGSQPLSHSTGSSAYPSTTSG